jgi:hypothetical protein
VWIPGWLKLCTIKWREISREPISRNSHYIRNASNWNNCPLDVLAHTLIDIFAVFSISVVLFVLLHILTLNRFLCLLSTIYYSIPISNIIQRIHILRRISSQQVTTAVAIQYHTHLVLLLQLSTTHCLLTFTIVV